MRPNLTQYIKKCDMQTLLKLLELIREEIKKRGKMQEASQQMNKQQILEQIDELKQKIEVLEKKVNSPEFEGIKKSVRQMPKKGEVYYFVDSAGYVSHTYWAGGEEDLFRFNTGNCFKTEQEAIDFKENLITKQQLKDLALEINNGVEIDWDYYYQLKYYILYNNKFKTLSIDFDRNHQCSSKIYCINPNFLDIAKDRIGEEKLIKLIKSGV